MTERLHVSAPAGLLDFLRARLTGWSRAAIKQRLQTGSVFVNGERVTRHDHPVQAGDQVEVRARTERPIVGDGPIRVLFADDRLIAIDKPAGLLSVGTAREPDRHALAMLRRQLSGGRRAPDLWPIHRLDRDTSGVLLFTTDSATREAVIAAWPEAEKGYLAVVEGCPEPRAGTIDRPLRMDERGFRALVGAHPDARPATTHYAVIRTTGPRSLVEVRTDTGRQHQIRAHLAWLGHPVVGDARYGTKGPRLGLHAARLTIPNPAGGEPLTFEAPAPRELLALLG